MRWSPLATGSTWALGAAIAFGATTPLVQRFGRGVGPFSTAGLLYAGAAILSLVVSARPTSPQDAPLRLGDAGRLLLVAALGAFLAPVALAWGLARTNGVTASLLLNAEALFTVILARLVWREAIETRVAWSLVATAAAGMLLIARAARAARVDAASVGTAWGALAVAAATLGWALDNVISRPLAERDPTQVVRAKTTAGAALSFGLAHALGEGWPGWRTASALVACGAIGYGASLDFYLRAQRRVGAGRTGAIFAAAPFVGAGFAVLLGERSGGWITAAAVLLSGLGVAMHLTEKHEHEHEHERMIHEHAHRHDDGHHDHAHGDANQGSAKAQVHSHRHEHARARHEHAHAPDLHHRHDHR